MNLLWWEWPEPRHERPHNGCSVDFTQPLAGAGGVVPNPNMTEDKQATAVEFVEKILEMGVLECVPKGMEMRA